MRNPTNEHSISDPELQAAQDLTAMADQLLKDHDAIEKPYGWWGSPSSDPRDVMCTVSEITAPDTTSLTRRTDTDGSISYVYASLKPKDAVKRENRELKKLGIRNSAGGAHTTNPYRYNTWKVDSSYVQVGDDAWPPITQGTQLHASDINDLQRTIETAFKSPESPTGGVVKRILGRRAVRNA